LVNKRLLALNAPVCFGSYSLGYAYLRVDHQSAVDRTDEKSD